MNFRKHAALPLVALAMTLPVMAQANSLYHPADTDAGYTEHPDHWKSTKTRAQVMAEVEAARNTACCLSGLAAAAAAVKLVRLSCCWSSACCCCCCC